MTFDNIRILGDCIANRTLVRIVRSGIQTADDKLEGVPVAVGKKWIVIVRMDESIHLDGFVALPLVLVTGIEPQFPRRSFYVRALQRKRVVMPLLPALNLDTTPELLRSAQNWFSLLVVERELLDPQSNVIGTLVKASTQTVQLRLITPSANWERQSYRINTADISKVGFGGEYENTLADVAGLKDPQWR